MDAVGARHPSQQVDPVLGDERAVGLAVEGKVVGAVDRGEPGGGGPGQTVFADGDAGEYLPVRVGEIEDAALDLDAVDPRAVAVGLHQRVVQHLDDLARLRFETVHHSRARIADQEPFPVLAQDRDSVQQDRVRKLGHQRNSGRLRLGRVGVVVAHVDPVDRPGAGHGAEGAGIEAPDDDKELIPAHLGDAGAAGGIGEGMDQLDRIDATIIDLEDLRRRESGGENFAVAPNGEVLQPCSDGELMNNFDGEGEGGQVPLLARMQQRLRQGGNDQQDTEKHHGEEGGDLHDGLAMFFNWQVFVNG